MQTTLRKTTLMLLGRDHLNNPGVNYINFQYDDVFAPKRQREIKQLTAFSPTKIAIAVAESLDDEILKQYQQQFLEDSGIYTVENVLKYLRENPS